MFWQDFRVFSSLGAHLEFSLIFKIEHVFINVYGCILFHPRIHLKNNLLCYLSAKRPFTVHWAEHKTMGLDVFVKQATVVKVLLSLLWYNR